MSIIGYLEKVRSRPEPEKRRLVIIWAISGTLFIVLLWLANMFVLMPRASNEELIKQKEEFSEITGYIGETVDQIYYGFEVIKEEGQKLFK